MRRINHTPPGVGTWSSHHSGVSHWTRFHWSGFYLDLVSVGNSFLSFRSPALIKPKTIGVFGASEDLALTFRAPFTYSIHVTLVDKKPELIFGI